ncbi:MAG TPA: hypothetical protein VGJ84_22380, partial [Polyangiaceae bacterium]
MHSEPSKLLPEVGYNYSQIETPRINATGEAQRALSNSLSALFINPANMMATRVYHVGAFAQIWPEARRQSYGAAAVDSIVSRWGLAGGIGGSWNRQDPDGLKRQWTDLRFALALELSDLFLVGLGGRYLSLGQDGFSGPLPPSLASGGLKDKRIINGFSLDTGATFRPLKQLSVALVGNNITNPDNGLQPASLGGGVGVALDILSLEADMVGDFTTWSKTTLRAMAG